MLSYAIASAAATDISFKRNFSFKRIPLYVGSPYTIFLVFPDLPMLLSPALPKGKFPTRLN